MPFETFHTKVPEIGLHETRSVLITDNNAFNLPPDEYGFIESYCNDNNCDCRRVFLNVFSFQKKTTAATIAWGWEDYKFYKKWFGSANFDFKELKGPSLELLNPQTEIAPQLLQFIKDVLINDKEYVARLKTHYYLFKEKVANKRFDKKSLYRYSK